MIICSMVRSLSTMYMGGFIVFLSSFSQCWSLLSLNQYLCVWPLRGPGPLPFFFLLCFLLILDCWDGSGDWFSVWVLFCLLPPVCLAASWAAKVAVSV